MENEKKYRLETLVIHTATAAHQQLTTEEQLSSGVTEDYIRVSIGTEYIDDIIKDFSGALEKSQR